MISFSIFFLSGGDPDPRPLRLVGDADASKTSMAEANNSAWDNFFDSSSFGSETVSGPMGLIKLTPLLVTLFVRGRPFSFTFKLKGVVTEEVAIVASDLDFGLAGWLHLGLAVFGWFRLGFAVFG